MQLGRNASQAKVELTDRRPGPERGRRDAQPWFRLAARGRCRWGVDPTSRERWQRPVRRPADNATETDID